jgi:excinuclease ABC subunit B
MSLTLHAPYQPAGDQPRAIAELVKGLREQTETQTLLGVTGSGKTYTIASVLAEVDRPALVLSHNKTLAAQLYSEFSQFFPENKVEYFISYYDYYQPEAYMPATGTYIEKDLSINEEIEKMRLRTTSTLLSGRRDVVVVSSVACIYGMSNPADFGKNVVTLRRGDTIARKQLLLKLSNLLYSRVSNTFKPGTFRVKGDHVDIFLAYADYAIRLNFWGNELEDIQRLIPTTGEILQREGDAITIFPANLFVTSKEGIDRAAHEIEVDLAAQVAFFQQKDKMEEASRIEKRTLRDIEMMRELGYCSGIENYSRYFDRRHPGQRPYCLLDYLPQDALIIVDESHVTLPQVRAMWGGDHARKRHLVDYGFRLPAAIDNRPLSFEEFESYKRQTIYVSATPADYELAKCEGVVVEQIIRPTGLLDPEITIKHSKHQIDDLLAAINLRTAKRERTLVTTLTKKMAEELTQYLSNLNVKCCYIHSDVKTLDRVSILEDLRAGIFDVLIGVNLLREGLDLPEVSLVAILDADKEGFLRNERSLIQTIGRAARHPNGTVILYADRMTKSITQAVGETRRRRKLQMAHNKKHNITPMQTQKAKGALRNTKATITLHNAEHIRIAAEISSNYNSPKQLKKRIAEVRRHMKEAVQATNYTLAKRFKEELLLLEEELKKLDD